jgi:hypothetical protein
MNDNYFSMLISDAVTEIVESVGLDSSRWRQRLYSMLKPKFDAARQNKGGAEQQTDNTGSPKCACPWIKPCDFNGEGACTYSQPNNSGALRAGA